MPKAGAKIELLTKGERAKIAKMYKALLEDPNYVAPKIEIHVDDIPMLVGGGFDFDPRRKRIED